MWYVITAIVSFVAGLLAGTKYGPDLYAKYKDVERELPNAG